VSGLGELAGYGARLASGWAADRTGRYWAITIVGYLVNLFAVPLLALAGSRQIAVVLVVAERLGRGIRSPVRDAMLSHAGSQTGLGWGFGLHQALDQTGAVLGPLMVSGVLFLGGDYRAGFAVLAIPAVLSIAMLVLARVQFPRPHDLAIRATAAMLPAAWIPILYGIAMAVDGGAGLALGTLFDRIGIRAMLLATFLSAAAAPLVFLGGFAPAVVGMACWGIGTGAQESVMCATVAQLAPRDRRATAFGIFNAVYGIAWFAGSVLLGVLYDLSGVGLAVASAVLQAAALPVLIRLTAGRESAVTAP
jgi:MFS family permease